jgi:polyketide biosynthesis acyl carrier protein
MDKQTIFRIVIGNVREVIPELALHNVAAVDDLASLGANSLDRAEIVNLTLEKLALDIPRIDLINAKSIGALVDLLQAKL